MIKCRGWDTAGTVAGHGLDPDYIVGVLLGINADNDIFYVLDVIRGRWSPGDVEKKIKLTAMCDGEKTRIYYPQAPGAAGRFEAYKMVGELQGYMVSTEREIGDKADRADPFAAQCQHGYVKLLEASWNDAFVDELCAFPNAAHDDQVDAVCGAFRTLVRRPQYGWIAV